MESAPGQANANLSMTQRKGERLSNQPARLQTKEKALPKDKTKKAKGREKVVAKALTVRNPKYLEVYHLQVRPISYHASIFCGMESAQKGKVVHIGILHLVATFRMGPARKEIPVLFSIAENPQPCQRRRIPPEERGDLLKNHLSTPKGTKRKHPGQLHAKERRLLLQKQAAVTLQLDWSLQTWLWEQKV